MITGIGTDIIEVDRIKKSIERQGVRFLEKIFTQAEREYCLRYKESARHFAGRFAAKEAIVKAIGCGIGEEISWLDIDIRNDKEGKPLCFFSEKAKAWIGDALQIHLSISHCHTHAMATAICVKVSS